MMHRYSPFFLAFVFLAFGLHSAAHGQAKEDPAHQELRNLLKQVLDAYNAGDVDRMLAVFDDNAVVTWQNGTVTKGPAQIKAFYEKMTKGPDRIVEKITIKPEPDELSILYNDGKTAVAWGNSKDHYLLTDGMDFDQDTRWSATLVKKDGQWKVASVHISVNLFDNPVLHIAVKKVARLVGAAAAVAGVILGLIFGYLLGRRRTKIA